MTFPLPPRDVATIALLKARAYRAPFLRPATAESITPHRAFLECGLTIIVTTDKGHWFPNEHWQNCLHLSLSETAHIPKEPDAERERAVIEAVFPAQHHELLCLEHRPESPVHHWRLFFTDEGEFIVPQGEQYTRCGSADYFRRREKAKAAMHGEEERS